MSDMIQWLIFTELKNRGPLTRSEIVTIVGYARTTIYDNLKMLEDRGRIEHYRENKHTKGRPKVFWRVKKNE